MVDTIIVEFEHVAALFLNFEKMCLQLLTARKVFFLIQFPYKTNITFKIKQRNYNIKLNNN